MTLPALDTMRLGQNGKVLTATIDNGPLNLVDPAWVNDLVDLLDWIETAPEVRVVVFDSAIPDFFIAHVDLTKVPEYSAAAARSGGPDDLGIGALFRRISDARPVTIALVEGRARGGGSEFVLACDLAFASQERAVFGQPEIGSGAFTGGGAAQHLTRLLGRSRALEVLLGSDDWSADEASRIGWINKSIPDALLRKEVYALATRIASFPEKSVRLAKRRVNAIALPAKEDIYVDAGFFQLFAGDPETVRRLELLFEAGLQTPGDTELNYGAVLRSLGD